MRERGFRAWSRFVHRSGAFLLLGPLPCRDKGQVQARFVVRQLLSRMHSYGSRVFDFHPVCRWSTCRECFLS